MSVANPARPPTSKRPISAALNRGFILGCMPVEVETQDSALRVTLTGPLIDLRDPTWVGASKPMPAENDQSDSIIFIMRSTQPVVKPKPSTPVRFVPPWLRPPLRSKGSSLHHNW